MATKKGDGYLHGPIKGKTQYHNENTDTYTERDKKTGQFTRGRKGKPYKGVTKEN